MAGGRGGAQPLVCCSAPQNFSSWGDEAVPQVAASRNSPGQIVGASLDFCASSESRCLSLLGVCHVPRPLKTAWAVCGDTSKNGPRARGCPVQGMRQKRCWLASHCHQQDFLASARVKPCCRLRVNHQNVHMAELRGKEAEFPQGRQRKPQPRAPWGCRGRRS